MAKKKASGEKNKRKSGRANSRSRRKTRSRRRELKQFHTERTHSPHHDPLPNDRDEVLEAAFGPGDELEHIETTAEARRAEAEEDLRVPEDLDLVDEVGAQFRDE